MTTIVAIQGDGFAVVCSDSRISDMDKDGYVSQITTLRDGISKVYSNGKYLLGAAGDLRAINILHHAFTPPPIPNGTKGKKLDHFFTSKFIPALRECFEEQGYAMPDKDAKSHCRFAAGPLDGRHLGHVERASVDAVCPVEAFASIHFSSLQATL
jgi:hypothetical protein